MSSSWLSRLLGGRDALHASSHTSGDALSRDADSYRAMCDAIDAFSAAFAQRTFYELRAPLAKLCAAFGAAAVAELIARQDRARPSIYFARCLVELLPDDLAEPYLERLVVDETLGTDARMRLAKLATRRGNAARADELLQSVIADDIHHAEARRLLATTQTFASAAAPGATLFGVANSHISLTERYELERELGRGAEGVVYLAADRRLQRQVAIKIFHQHATQNEAFPVLRRLAELPRYPIFIRVFDLDPQGHFFVMEYCSGGSLADFVASELPSVNAAIEITVALCNAIATLDAAQLVHGDLKPTNILFRTAARTTSDLVLSDFGRVRKPDDANAIAGTLAYMSPSALRGDAQSQSGGQDLFALGIIFLQLLGVPDLPILRRQLLQQNNPAPQLFAAIPPQRLAPFAHHAEKLRAVIYAMLNAAAPAQIALQLHALKKDIAI